MSAKLIVDALADIPFVPFEVTTDNGSAILVPVSARKQLNDLPDELVTKVNILFYADAREALLKAIAE